MSRAIVITTIFEPSDAVRAYAALTDHRLIVVGDRKTPGDWACDGADYLSLERQRAMGPALAKSLPYDHYCRKMFGYLAGARDGAEVIVDTDDDNHPKPDWGFPAFDAAFEVVGSQRGFVNIYQWFTKAPIWPRGLPLDLVRTRFDTGHVSPATPCRVGVWQGLADEDPDVDAIYRLTTDQPCVFEARPPLVLPEGTYSPFNSQNTAIRKELFPLLYLPAYVTFRFTDILRGLVAQPIMWLHGYTLGFAAATVVQKRNPHDYMQDFAAEVPMYLHCRRVVEIVSAALSARESLECNLHAAYSSLRAEGIVRDVEIRALEAWLRDLQRAQADG